MQFEWDEDKRQANIAKHKIDFARARLVFDDDHITESLPYEGEPRWITIGLLEGREITIIYTTRNEKIRIISARRARSNERRKYQELYQEAARRDDRTR
jgi:uncharacterized protein